MVHMDDHGTVAATRRRNGLGRNGAHFPDQAETHVRGLLEALGEDPARDGLRDTPARVLRSLREMTQGYHEDPAEILAQKFGAESREMVVLRRVPFRSLCEHHLLPFEGHATVAYIPDDGVLGLSKLARLVRCFARRLQVQERMTQQIVDALMEHGGAQGAAALVEAEHACMRLRGVREEATMVTSAYRGVLDAPGQRQEFLAHARNP